MKSGSWSSYRAAGALGPQEPDDDTPRQGEPMQYEVVTQYSHENDIGEFNYGPPVVVHVVDTKEAAEELASKLRVPKTRAWVREKHRPH